LTKEFTDNSLTSIRFKNFEVGTHLVLRLRVNPESRKINSVLEVQPKDYSPHQFIAEYGDTLMRETENLEKARVIWGVATEKKVDVPSTSPSTPSYKVDSNWVGNMYVESQMQKVFESARRASETLPAKILMVGASGFGKTSIPKAMAEKFGMDFYRVNCATMRDTTDWLGSLEAVDGSTLMVKSDLANKMEDGNIVIVMDEFNRVQPWVHNTLFPLFDDDAKTEWKNVEFKVGPNVIFVFTINFGWQYAGTFELDTAMMNRVDMTIKVGELPTRIETQLLTKVYGTTESEALTIVNVVRRLRKASFEGKLSVDCSTRTSLKIAKQFSFGVLTMRECFESIITAGILEESESRVAYDIINSAL
jgi:hypothetical protein